MFAYFGASSSSGTPIDRYEFPYRGVVANGSGSDFTLKFQVLRNSGNNGSRKNADIAANTSPIKDGYVWPDPGIVTNDDVFVDVTKRAYRYIGPDFGIGVYRRKVQLVHLQVRLTIWAVRPASETILLPT